MAVIMHTKRSVKKEIMGNCGSKESNNKHGMIYRSTEIGTFKRMLEGTESNDISSKTSIEIGSVNIVAENVIETIEIKALIDFRKGIRRGRRRSKKRMVFCPKRNIPSVAETDSNNPISMTATGDEKHMIAIERNKTVPVSRRDPQ